MDTLDQVKAAYPAAKLSIDGRGMMLETSPPPVLKRLVQVIHKSGDNYRKIDDS
jgi:hypothetical protein